jgi:hypothetical protein
VIYGPGGRALWTSRTAGKAGADGVHPFIDVLPDGQFEVEVTPSNTKGGGITSVWSSTVRTGQSGLTRTQARLRMLTQRCTLQPGHYLESDSGYRFALRQTGNMVLRSPSGQVVWRSHTGGHSGAVLTLTSRGRLRLHLGSTTYWSAPIRYDAVNFVVQNNGNAVAHDYTGAVDWSTHTGG